MKPIERIREVIAHKNMSVSAFEKAVGMSNNSIQTALKRKSNLKDDTLNSILKAFPEISAEWLLTGKGNMIEIASVNEDELAYPDDKDYIINLQKEFINKLKDEIRILKSPD